MIVTVQLPSDRLLLQQVGRRLGVGEGGRAADGAHAREAEPATDALLVEAATRSETVSVRTQPSRTGWVDAHVQAFGQDDSELIDLEASEADLSGKTSDE